MSPLLEIEALRVAFGDSIAVRDVSLAVAPGERLGLVGESGSGKTLTALSVAGLLPEGAARSGTIRFAGAPLPEGEREMARLRGRRIAMVFQEPMSALNPLMRAADQIAEAVALNRPGTAPRAAAASLLAEVGLTEAQGRCWPHQLSGGQRQRVMIAIALAGDPDLLIADEPTSALDLITQRTVLDLIAEVCDRRGMALLFVSHDLKAVAALCPRVAVMHRGAIVESGLSAEVLSRPADPYTQRLVAAARPLDRRAPPKAAPAPLLEIAHLRRIFRQPRPPFAPPVETVALDDVSLTLDDGRSVALVGPSGCGKTTLARIVVGLDRATSGTLRFAGKAYGGGDLPPALRRDLSLVFQDPYGSFDPRLSVGRSVAQPLRLLPDLGPDARRARVEETVRAVGLDPAVLDRFPHEFSGGQRQRLAIARALVTRPRLVVLDEPVSALDVSIRGDVLALLADLRARFGLAYLVISHDLDMVASIADTVLVMDAGRIVEAGPPEALFARPSHTLTRALVAARLPEIA